MVLKIILVHLVAMAFEGTAQFYGFIGQPGIYGFVAGGAETLWFGIGGLLAKSTSGTATQHHYVGLSLVCILLLIWSASKQWL